MPKTKKKKGKKDKQDKKSAIKAEADRRTGPAGRQVTCNLTEVEFQQVEVAAKRFGMSTQGFIRLAALYCSSARLCFTDGAGSRVSLSSGP